MNAENCENIKIENDDILSRTKKENCCDIEMLQKDSDNGKTSFGSIQHEMRSLQSEDITAIYSSSYEDVKLEYDELSIVKAEDYDIEIKSEFDDEIEEKLEETIHHTLSLTPEACNLFNEELRSQSNANNNDKQRFSTNTCEDECIRIPSMYTNRHQVMQEENTRKDSGSDVYKNRNETAEASIVVGEANYSFMIRRPNTIFNDTVSEKSDIEQNTKGKRKIRGKIHCCFCNVSVLNFSRHVLRHHSNEPEVEKCSDLEPNSKERKEFFNALRKRGNSVIEKPVRKHLSPGKSVPCSNCLGYYSYKSLCRHKKKCMKQSNSKEGQNNTTFESARLDPDLKKKIFERMRPDEITAVASTDQLICAYGVRSIEKNGDVRAASRKIRELARLLIELRKLNEKVTSLFSALDPKYFTFIVESVKLVAQFNEETRSYSCATYALNIATSLKKCCDLAIAFHGFAEKSACGEILPDKATISRLKSMKFLLQEQWKFEITLQDLSVLQSWSDKATVAPLDIDDESQKTDTDASKLEENICKVSSLRDSTERGERLVEVNLDFETDMSGEKDKSAEVQNARSFREEYYISERKRFKRSYNMNASNTKKRKIKREPWTPEQKQLVVKYFENHIQQKTPPKKHECMKLKKNFPILNNKSFEKIKVYIQNVYSKRVKL